MYQYSTRSNIRSKIWTTMVEGEGACERENEKIDRPSERTEADNGDGPKIWKNGNKRDWDDVANSLIIYSVAVPRRGPV